MQVRSVWFIIGLLAICTGCMKTDNPSSVSAPQPLPAEANTGAGGGDERGSSDSAARDQSSNQTPQPTPPVSTPATRSYEGPPIEVRVNKVGTQVGTVLLTATAPTGGWTFEVAETKYVGSSLQLFMTLEGPGADEWVTQALTEHKQEFAADKPFATVEVFVHLARRDVQTLTTDYRLAAKADAPAPL